jgi:hypothetical protein
MPSNITRGNVEGLIAISFTPPTLLVIPNYTSVEVDYTVPGVLANDIAISLSLPSFSPGIGVGNIRVKSAGVVSVTFGNADIAQQLPGGVYTLVLGRLSNASLLPTVAF